MTSQEHDNLYKAVTSLAAHLQQLAATQTRQAQDLHHLCAFTIRIETRLNKIRPCPHNN